MSARGWAYLGAFLGGSVSVAANVAHSYVPPAGSPADWAPYAGAVAGAVFWPVALLVAVEVLARTSWPAGRRWVAVRWAGVLPVAVVAAVVSYRHLSGLLDWYGEDALTATVGPLAVDGLMVTATAALLAMAGREVAAVSADTVSGAAHDVEEDQAEELDVPAGLWAVPAGEERDRDEVTVTAGRVRCPAGCGREVSARTARRHRDGGCPEEVTG